MTNNHFKYIPHEHMFICCTLCGTDQTLLIASTTISKTSNEDNSIQREVMKSFSGDIDEKVRLLSIKVQTRQT